MNQQTQPNMNEIMAQMQALMAQNKALQDQLNAQPAGYAKRIVKANSKSGLFICDNTQRVDAVTKEGKPYKASLSMNLTIPQITLMLNILKNKSFQDGILHAINTGKEWREA